MALTNRDEGGPNGLPSFATGLTESDRLATLLAKEDRRMNWTLGDFVFAGAMLGALVFGAFALFRLKRSRAYRIGLFVFILASVLLLWITGAVGIVGNSDNDANMLYPGFLAASILASLIFRFRSLWLSRILATLSLGLVFIAGAALILGWGTTGAAWPWDVIFGSGVFAFLFMAAAWLFGLDADIRTLNDG